jgi:glucose-6-phosphate-specific signal transduction histidine kinase
MITELFNNIMKHSYANQMTYYKQMQQTTIIVTDDNGRGFDMNDLKLN